MVARQSGWIFLFVALTLVPLAIGMRNQAGGRAGGREIETDLRTLKQTGNATGRQYLALPGFLCKQESSIDSEPS